MAAQAGLCLASSETHEDTFSHDEAQLNSGDKIDIQKINIIQFLTYMQVAHEHELLIHVITSM